VASLASRIVLVLVASCGRIGFSPLDDASPCASFGPWSTPTPLDTLNSPATDYGAQITPDGLTLYFDSDRTGTNEVYVAQRSDRGSPFGAPVRESALSGGSFTGDQSPTGDQLELYFDSTRSGTSCIYVAHRADVGSAWNAPTVTALCDDAGPYVTPDGSTLLYNSSLDTTGEGAIYVTTRASRADPFTVGSTVAGIALPQRAGYPALSGDQLTLYFEAESGPGGNLELWQAARAAIGDGFGAPQRVPGVNSGAGDQDASITADGTELYFATNRSGNADLVIATRSCS